MRSCTNRIANNLLSPVINRGLLLAGGRWQVAGGSADAVAIKKFFTTKDEKN